MIIRELSELEFNEFVQKFPFNSIYQTTEYANVMETEEYSKLYVGGIENGKLVAASLILIKKIKNFNYAYAPRGFLIDYNNSIQLTNFTNEVKKYLGKIDVVAIKLCPIIAKNLLNGEGSVIGNNPNFKSIFDNLISLGYYHYGFNSYFEAYQPRFEALIDLTLPINELFNNIKKEYKCKIRSAESRGIKIYRANLNEIEYLYSQIKNKNKKSIDYIKNVFNEFGKQNKLDYYYAKLDTKIYLERIKIEYEAQENYVSTINNSVLDRVDTSDKILNKKIEADNKLANLKTTLIEATNLIREYPTGLVLATIVIIKHHSEINVFMDAYDVKFKQFNAKHILLWKIIENYSKLGFKRINLGGVIDPRIKDEKYDGLNLFKLNFNSSILEYIGDLELVTNKTKYFLYKQLVKPNK